MNTVNAEVDRLVARYRSNPPTGARAVAEFRHELWNAYPRSLRRKLRKRNSKRAFFPELPELNNALGYVCDFVLRARQEHRLDVDPCWVALDSKMPPYLVQSALSTAKAQLRDDPGIDFRAVLSALLDESRSEHVPDPIAEAAAPPVAAAAPVAPPPTPTRPKRTGKPPAATALPPTERTMIKLGEPYDTWVATAMNAYRISAADFHRICLRQACTAFGIIQMSERAADVEAALAALPRELTPKPSVNAKPPAKAKPPVKAKPRAKSATKPAKPVAEKSKFSPQKHGLPPLHERLRIVAGADEVSIPEAIDRLTARGSDWLPDSGDMKAYISLSFSTHTKDLFKRVKRGVYRVQDHRITLENPFSATPVVNGSNARSQPS